MLWCRASAPNRLWNVPTLRTAQQTMDFGSNALMMQAFEELCKTVESVRSMFCVGVLGSRGGVVLEKRLRYLNAEGDDPDRAPRYR